LCKHNEQHASQTSTENKQHKSIYSFQPRSAFITGGRVFEQRTIDFVLPNTSFGWWK